MKLHIYNIEYKNHLSTNNVNIQRNISSLLTMDNVNFKGFPGYKFAAISTREITADHYYHFYLVVHIKFAW